MNKDFLKEVLAGKKQLMKKAEVKYVTVPHYDELSVKGLYPMFTKDAEMMAYFPSKYPKGKQAPRDYFFNILATLHPDYLQQVMAHASKQRHTAEGEGMARESIQISEYWEEQLRAMPYLSRKCQNFLTCLIFIVYEQRKTGKRSIY